MNVSTAQIERCVSWIQSLDGEALALLAQLLQIGGDPTGVAAKLPTDPPDREGAIALEEPFQWIDE